MWIAQGVQSFSFLQPVLWDLSRTVKVLLPLRSWCRHCPSWTGWLQPIQDPQEHGAHWLLLSHRLSAQDTFRTGVPSFARGDLPEYAAECGT